MVVMVILGILISLAVLSIGTSSTSRELRDEAQRLAAVVGVLSDEAVLDSREYGLWLDDDRYRVLRYDDIGARWVATADSLHRMPDWARLDLTLDGTPLQLAAPAESDEQEAPGLSEDAPEAAPLAPGEKAMASGVQPQILILSSGELSPFSLRISERDAPDNAWRVSSDGFARPQAEPVEDRRG